ncbi:MAG: hypothetical protein ABI613_03190 [Gemmatimonadota bacterium]
MRSRTLVFLGGAMLGLTAGWLVGQRQLVKSREDLFSPQPLKRLSALGFISGLPAVDTVRLLRDYLAWESQPMLRHRAQRILRRIEATLG